MSPSRGRVLIYVWAIEQDELSKRTVPIKPYTEDTSAAASVRGQDVFVPWVVSTQNSKPKGKSRKGHVLSRLDLADSSNFTNDPSAETQAPATSEPHKSQVFNRYYHMFAEGELTELVRSAASDLGLHIGPVSDDWPLGTVRRGLTIVQDGWERSNYYVELQCWEN